jgi:glycerate 2-kinase
VVVPERPVLVAPAPFAPALRATEAAAAIGRGLERAGLMPPDLCPVADGGPGTIEVLLPRLGGELRDGFALVDDGGTAIVESGELIPAAVEAGAAVIVVAAGAAGDVALEGAGGARLVVLCDTREALTEAPAGWPRDPRGVPMTAAGGGLAGALWAFHGAVLEPGGPWVLDALGFDARMRAARAVVTGEGTLEDRSLEGGLVGEIGTRARQAGVPCHAIVGADRLDAFGKRIIDLMRVIEAPGVPALEQAGEALGRELAEGLA